MSVIDIDKITKYYGSSRGVEDLSLQVEQGEIFGYLGPNGAGKTTTIRCLLGLIFPTGGKATVLGHDIVRDSYAIRQHTGYIPGDLNLYPKLTGGDTLDYFSRFRPDNKPVLKEALVRRFDLDLSKKFKELSRGNKQKLIIILALMHDPDLLILDEPTLGLDPLMQKEFYEVLKDFKERGKTVFLSSHILPDVEKTCERVGIVRDGKLVAIENVGAVETKKIRNVEVTFMDSVKREEFDIEGVSIIQANDREYKLRVKGMIDPVLKVLANHKVVDTIIEHASLEEMFMEFYGEGQ